MRCGKLRNQTLTAQEGRGLLLHNFICFCSVFIKGHHDFETLSNNENVMQWTKQEKEKNYARVIFPSISQVALSWPCHFFESFIWCVILFFLSIILFFPVRYLQCCRVKAVHHGAKLLWRFSTAWYGTVRFGTVHFWGVFHWVLYLVLF